MPRTKKSASTAESSTNAATVEQPSKPARMESFTRRTLDGRLFRVTRNIDTGEQSVEPA